MYKVPSKSIEKRLTAWKNFRQYLETSTTPFDDVVNFFDNLPKTKVYTDPYDQSSWPTPWELIEENEYCKFNLILGICYTLQLCEKFQDINPKITITVDRQDNSVYYLLYFSNLVYGYNGWVDVNDLSNSLKHIKIYNMPAIH